MILYFHSFSVTKYQLPFTLTERIFMLAIIDDLLSL